MQYAHIKIKIYLGNAFKASAAYSVICNPSNPTHNPQPMTPTLSTCAAENAKSLRLQAARLSVPDELYWYNNNTNWASLSRKEFRDLMIRMETITVQFYNDACAANNRSAAAIKTFWADEWGCEYLPESGRWLDLATGTFIESETEKKAKKEAKKEAKKALKKAKKEAKQTAQYNDEEEELYAQAVQQQQQQPYDNDDWYDAEEEAYAEAYASARAQQEQQEQQQQQQEQQEAQAYLDSLFESTSETPTTRVTCQPVLYFEEEHVKGDPDWRAYIYYDARIRRYVLKGTRRSLRATSRKTRYPELQLSFRSLFVHAERRGRRAFQLCCVLNRAQNTYMTCVSM